MSIKLVEDAISKIDASGLTRPYLQTKNGVSDVQIDEAEKIIGFAFPASFRFFLKNYGRGKFEGKEFYGLIKERNDLEEVPNSLWYTLDLRNTEGFPEDFYVVEDLDDGATACLKLSENINNECPVVLWDLGEGRLYNPRILARNFGEYFYQRILQALESRAFAR